jgi:Metallo-beta-lactamase superfamily
MIFRQFLHADPVAASYLIGCGGKSAAAVVDPVGDIAPYLEAAENSGMQILYVIDTHLHADHISAGRKLATAAGAEYILSSAASAFFSFKGVNDRDILALGNVEMEVLHTLLCRSGEVHLYRPALQHALRLRALRRQPRAHAMAGHDVAPAGTAPRSSCRGWLDLGVHRRQRGSVDSTAKRNGSSKPDFEIPAKLSKEGFDR